MARSLLASWTGATAPERTLVMNSFEPRSIVCPIQLSTNDEAVIETATSIAKRFGAHLHLVHVWSPPVLVALDGALIPSARDLVDTTEDLRVRLEEAATAARARHADVEADLLQGTVWKEIVDFADHKGCDLIVAGTHQRSGLAHFLDGSVAEHVVRGTHVPVLIVPQVASQAELGAANVEQGAA
jgi:universal stress protein A